MSERDKAEILKKWFLEGHTRHDVARKVGVGDGTVSGVTREFSDCVKEYGLDDCVEDFDVDGSLYGLHDLRALAVELRKKGTTAEELLELKFLSDRLDGLGIPRERLEGFVKAAEKLGDKAYVEAAMKLQDLEEETGLTYHELPLEVEREENRLKELSNKFEHRRGELQQLNTEIKEKQRLLKQYDLTMPQIEHLSHMEKELKRYGIDLTDLEASLQVMLSMQEAGYDPKKVIEQIKTLGTLKDQIEARKRQLLHINGNINIITETLSKIEGRITNLEIMVNTYHELKSLGWTDMSLGKLLTLTREAGNPEEVLSRAELLKPSASTSAELERARAETETLKGEILKVLQEASERVARASENLSSLTALTEKYDRKQESYNKLNEEYQRLQRSLDDAISWTTFINNPEKLPGDRIGRIFFDVMLPRFETWLKAQEKNYRFDTIQELTKRLIYNYYPELAKPVANFFKDPENTSETDASAALVVFFTASLPFYSAFRRWNILHKPSKFNTAYDHLNKFIEEVKRVYK